jgi:integrase
LLATSTANPYTDRYRDIILTEGNLYRLLCLRNCAQLSAIVSYSYQWSYQMSSKNKTIEICPNVSIGLNHGINLRLVISGTLYEDGKKRFIPLRLTESPHNRILAAQRQLQIQSEINDGTFDPTLTKYLVWHESKPNLYRSDKTVTIDTLWNGICSYRKPGLAPSTYIQKFQGTFTRSLTEIGMDKPITPTTARYTREWLIDNRNKSDNVWLLSELEKGVARLINEGILGCGNPFLGMGKALAGERNTQIDDRPIEDIVNEFQTRRYYTEAEMLAILKCFHDTYPHYWLFTYFRFYTGCRFEETTGLQWGDITHDCRTIVFRRTYSQVAKQTKTTKLGTARPFQCSEQLTQLLQAHRIRAHKGNDSDIVFKNSSGGYVALNYYRKMWSKIIQHLYGQGKIEVMLSPKFTRHTLSNLAGLAGVSESVLAQQMGHSPRIMNANYRDKTVDRSTVIEI